MNSNRAQHELCHQVFVSYFMTDFLPLLSDCDKCVTAVVMLITGRLAIHDGQHMHGKNHCCGCCCAG